MFDNEETKRKQLIEEIERLKKENKKLIDDIDIIEQKDERLRAKHRIGDNKKLYYWKLPVKFINTVFYTRKAELAKDNDICMVDEMQHYFSFASSLGKESEVFHMAVFCEDVIETTEGYRLALLDPYKRMLSNELYIDSNTAYAMKGKILYIDCMEVDNNIVIKRWKTTSLTLNGYKGEQDPVNNPITSALLDVKDIHTEEEAVAAVTALQNYYRMTQENIKVARISPTEIRMLKLNGPNKAILYGIKFTEGEFWLYEEPEHEYISYENDDEFIKEIHAILNIHDSRDERTRNRWVFTYMKEKTPDIDYEK